MRPLRTLALLAAFATALSLGYAIGLLHASLPAPHAPSALQLRTEAFEPDCAMLRAAGSQPLLVRNGTDWILVLAHGERFTVLGINLEGIPATAWWGAALPHALEQACTPGDARNDGS